MTVKHVNCFIPLDITKAGSAEAAKAEHIAKRLCLMLQRLCQRRHVLVGAYIRPPRHMFPKAA